MSGSSHLFAGMPLDSGYRLTGTSRSSSTTHTSTSASATAPCAVHFAFIALNDTSSAMAHIAGTERGPWR